MQANPDSMLPMQLAKAAEGYPTNDVVAAACFLIGQATQNLPPALILEVLNYLHAHAGYLQEKCEETHGVTFTKAKFDPSELRGGV